MRLRVILARAMGMCFGVRDALEVTKDISDPAGTTIHGELVHNEIVLRRLAERGFRMFEEADRSRLPETPAVLLTAHGISKAERRRLEEGGKRVIDTTCPLVARAHSAAARLEAEGFYVLVIGVAGHVEVRGLVGDLRNREVVETPEDVKAYPHRRLGVICQTTANPRQVEQIYRTLRARNPGAEIHLVDTVCQPTKDRQKALDDLLPLVDAMVVVGGRNSNNTRNLIRRCLEQKVPAHHVQCAGDLRPEWFAGVEAVGLTAGASTLDSVVDEVHRRLLEIAASSGATARGA